MLVFTRGQYHLQPVRKGTILNNHIYDSVSGRRNVPPIRAAGAITALVLTAVLLPGCASTSAVAKEDTITADYSTYELIGPKKRIYIAKFENTSAYGQRRLGTGISDVLTTELARTNLFLLLERERLDALLNEQSLAEMGVITAQSASEVGKLLGANAIILGSVTQFGVRTEAYDIIITSGKKQVATCAIDVRLVDVNTGSVLWAGSGQGEAVRSYTNILGTGTAGGYDEALEGDAFRAAVVRLMENLVPALNNSPWSCAVAKVSGDKIYINAGRKANLALGTRIAFYEQGEAIIDPTSGMELGREETLVGAGEVTAYLGEEGSILGLLEGRLPAVGSIGRLD